MNDWVALSFALLYFDEEMKVCVCVCVCVCVVWGGVTQISTHIPEGTLVGGTAN